MVSRWILIPVRESTARNGDVILAVVPGYYDQVVATRNPSGFLLIRLQRFGGTKWRRSPNGPSPNDLTNGHN